MRKEQKKKSTRPIISNINSYLMERDRAGDVAVQKLKESQLNQRRAK